LGDAGHRRLLAAPALNHRATSTRGIEPQCDSGCRDASGGLASHQALRAHAVRGSLDEPTPFWSARLNLQPFRGHAGDCADCTTLRPITYAASDRVGLERLS